MTLETHERLPWLVTKPLSSSFTEEAYAYIQLFFPLTSICDVIRELLTQRTLANYYGNDAALKQHLNLTLG